MKLSCEVINKLQGCTLVTAESCTGGGIGSALTAVPGSSAVYKGGIISYTNQVKTELLNVEPLVLEKQGAVSAEVARQMAIGARSCLSADYAVSVTGLAGPDGDTYGNPIGTVYIGFADQQKCVVKSYLFHGTRNQIRNQTIESALKLILDMIP